MHYLLTPDLKSYRNSDVLAYLLTSLSTDENARWLMLEEPWPDVPPKFQFKVRKNVLHPDNYCVDRGASINLYSRRLTNLLERFEVEFEAFPAELTWRF